MSNNTIMTSPNRRSTADLQRILDGLIGTEGSIRCGDLPEVLIKYEIENDAIILEPSEYEGLRTLCAQSPDLELDSKDIFSFLSIIPKYEPKQSSNLSHSVSMPLGSLHKAQATPPMPRKHNRRHSDRVKSSSDSSDSGSDEQHDKTVHANRIMPSGIPRPISHRNTHSLDPSAPTTPLAGRKHTPTFAPSSFSPLGGGFARPSPMNRRRRGSMRSPTPEENQSPDNRPLPTRHLSQTSIGRTSPPWSRETSPTTAHFEIESRSFHRGMTPEQADDDEDAEEADQSLHPGHMSESEADEEIDHVEEKLRNDSLNPRLSRISTESATSLRTSHDKLQILQKHNDELGRKLKEAEKQLAVLGSENERLVEDLQEKLEETKAEIAQKRKDEKELKSKDRAQLIQIAGFEADILSLQRTLEHAKKNHANLQTMYNDQCVETQRMRDLLKERDEEITRLEDASQIHEGEETKFNREVEALEHEVKRLEQDLSVARQAESHLEVQKQENLQLKETIDRMRFELDEAKTTAQGHSRGVTGSSGAPTLSRNLGAELSRRLVEAEEQDEEEDSYVETVVTRQRTRKVGNRSLSHGQHSDTPIIEIEEEIREYADVGTETEPFEAPTLIEAGPSLSSPPAYTADPDPLYAQQILDKTHPRGVVNGMGDYDGVVQATGLRCTVLEDELKARRAKFGEIPDLPAGTGRDRIIGYVYLDPAFFSKYGSYVLAAFAVGLFFGSSLFGASSRDVALFHRMNTLALASGAGEGLLPFGRRGVVGFMENGAKMVAGRVPS